MKHEEKLKHLINLVRVEEQLTFLKDNIGELSTRKQESLIHNARWKVEQVREVLQKEVKKGGRR